ncbi:Adenylate and Guanylate cyclase catalytic domain containing protein [Tritrichomonas foetus]|uniref:Adenylate and Guanylate cyclase catalytic domain containing protein n=1 Tax=Tritrichomonas foetus TaxID=1144522 RepID=A0A1J4KWC3_9EUKA|nr:Adenylate and Guanylate cyclase catalytic domain containing protein [Tritrichomonas foetus]|eukprot:OHT15458.1 Adenylate and Guanylate cyclase catalytic domain containing protein [Tritrichomonas foetus]
MIDQSVSRSLNDNGNTGIRHLLIHGRYSKVDVLFPLFDQMVQLTRLPTFLTSIFAIFLGFQFTIFSFWPIGKYWEDKDTPISYITLIFWFVSTPPAKTSLIIIFVILVVLFCMIFFWFFGLVMFYLRNLRFFTWGLYLCRFILECLCPTLVCSSSALVGASIWMLIHYHENYYWAFIITSIVVFIGYFLIYSIGNATIGRSSCIAISATSCFSQIIPISYLALNSISSILAYVFYSFPLYATCVFIVVHFSLLLFLYFSIYFQLPFHHKNANIFMATIISGQAGMDLVVFILFVINKSVSYAIMLLFFAFILIFGIGNYFLFKKRYEKIATDLFFPPNENKKDSEFMAYFEGLGLGYSEKLAITYLHVGLTQICPLFLNWSLVRFISQNYPSNYAICSTIQVLSYFPTEFRQMNSLFSLVTTRTDLNFINRFLIYQVYRIKTLRQSSTSSDANERLIKLRSLTEQCMSNVVAFWRCREPSISFFESLAKEEHRVNSLWLEAIRDYPNSAKLYEEYTTFLVECVTDFHSSVVMKQKAELIEHGSNFAVDASFRSLVWSIPNYVKNGVLDTKGNLLDYRPTKVSGSGSADSDISAMVTDIVETDSTGEFEQRLARQLFNKSKLRLAFDAALKDRTHKSFAALPGIAAICLIGGLSIFLSLFFFINTTFSTRKDSLNYINYMGAARFYFSMTLYLVLMKNIIDSGRYKARDIIMDAVNEDTFDVRFISNFDNVSQEIMVWVSQSRNFFARLLTFVTKQSLIDNNIYQIVSLFTSLSVNLNVMYDGRVIGQQIENIKNIYSFCYFLVSVLAAEESGKDFYFNDNFGMLILNDYSLGFNCDDLFQGFSDYAVRSGDSLIHTISILMILCPVLLFLISFCPYFSCSLVFIHHVDKIATVLTGLDRSIKDEAIDPIRQDLQPTIYSISDPTVRVTENVWFNVVNFFFSLFSALICFGMLQVAMDSNKMIDKLNIWNFNAARRLTTSSDLLTQCYHAIVLNETNSSNFMTRQNAISESNVVLGILDTVNNALLRGTDDLPSINGFDDELDSLNFKEGCTLDAPARDFHDSYRCGSTDKLLATLKDLTTPILTTPELFNGLIEKYEPAHLLHILNNHLWQRYSGTSDRITQLAVDSYGDLVDMMILFLCIGVIASFLVFSAGFFLRSSSRMTYSAALSELKRIPPHLIIADKGLKNILLNKNEESNTTTSISRNVLHNSTDSMLCVSLGGVVEMVNPAVTSTLGFTPEQVLGQPITSFFSDSDAQKVMNQMSVIQDSQNSAVYEDHVQCITDNRTLIPAYLTLLGMRRIEDSSIQSYVFILRNESDLLQQQAYAEEAKAKSENLLYHILPQTIVMKLNCGEKDICFTVPNATISFIDVVKFSEFTKNLAPTEIMGTLSQLFLSFDKLITNYPLITKIKLIGDIYMAAAGLFTEGANPTEHANQTINFALAAIAAIDDVNVKLNSNLQIRIGVNSGGPIIAGVLGTDKPVFDIIGDPINVAARLQTTDIPQHIQIPQSTYDLLTPGEYNVEPRGEVFLKGKGQVMTYLIMSDM